MPEDPSSNPPTPIPSKLPDLEDSDKPKIKILLYTDDQLVARGSGPPLGLGSMIDHIASHPLAFADLSIQWENRYPEGSTRAENKINVLLDREPFDQIWFFGIHQIKKLAFRRGINGGGPESELDKAEVSALRSRMDAGLLGVLVTGDHANHRPPDAVLDNPDSACDDEPRNAQFLGLGRALGRCIPRGGEMRDWEGRPTSDPRHSFNTQVVTFGTNINTETGFQQDSAGQQLILQTFNEQGKPSRQGRPHPLFFYRNGQAIQLFPDHLHEGAVTLPSDLDDNLWPRNEKGVQPEPRIVAYGLDKRNGKRLKLLATYDGDRVNAGRIVADSTWHHYFNVNLSGFPAQSAPFTAADQIGQFYANLALWLTPWAKRSLMTDTMSRWLAQQPAMAELVGPVPSKRLSDMMVTGGLAMSFLNQVASDCEIHELLQTVVPSSYSRRYESLYFPETAFSLSPLPSKELLLGSLIHKAPQEAPDTLDLETFSDARVSFRREAIANASDIAFKKQKLRVERTARLAKRLFENTTN